MPSEAPAASDENLYSENVVLRYKVMELQEQLRLNGRRRSRVSVCFFAVCARAWRLLTCCFRCRRPTASRFHRFDVDPAPSAAAQASAISDVRVVSLENIKDGIPSGSPSPPDKRPDTKPARPKGHQRNRLGGSLGSNAPLMQADEPAGPSGASSGASSPSGASLRRAPAGQSPTQPGERLYAEAGAAFQPHLGQVSDWVLEVLEQLGEVSDAKEVSIDLSSFSSESRSGAQAATELGVSASGGPPALARRLSHVSEADDEVADEVESPGRLAGRSPGRSPSMSQGRS